MLENVGRELQLSNKVSRPRDLWVGKLVPRNVSTSLESQPLTSQQDPALSELRVSSTSTVDEVLDTCAWVMSVCEHECMVASDHKQTWVLGRFESRQGEGSR